MGSQATTARDLRTTAARVDGRCIMNESQDPPSREPLQILYYGGAWPTNIGNAFIDLGAMSVLHTAAPGAEIAFAGQLPRWNLFRGAELPRWILWRRTRQKSRFLRDFERTRMEDAFDVASITACDVVVIAGMCMCDDFIQVNGPSVLALAKSGIPILFLGTGPWSYSAEERSNYRTFLRQLNPMAFASRDGPSFEMFADMFPESHRGIDCGFFCPEAYAPLPLRLPPYIVATFDKITDPPLDAGERLVIRAHHRAWGPTKRRYLRGRNILISDVPQDYLTLYASAQEVHTDRVHACVAALAYGRMARLYGRTGRAALFDEVGASTVKQKLTGCNMEALALRKKAQIDFVTCVLEKVAERRTEG